MSLETSAVRVQLVLEALGQEVFSSTLRAEVARVPGDVVVIVDESAPPN